MAIAIDRRGIEKVIADIEGPIEQALGIIRRRYVAIAVAQHHAAKADGVDQEGA